MNQQVPEVESKRWVHAGHRRRLMAEQREKQGAQRPRGWLDAALAQLTDLDFLMIEAEVARAGGREYQSWLARSLQCPVEIEPKSPDLLAPLNFVGW